MTDVVVVALAPPVTVSVALNPTAYIEVDLGRIGPPGAVGAAGPIGPVGPEGSASTEPYEHIQSTPSTVWTIVHNFGYYPGGITLVDSSKRVFMAEVSYVDTVVLIVTIAGAQSGFAYVS